MSTKKRKHDDAIAMSNDDTKHSVVLSSQPTCLRTLDEKDLIEALNPYVPVEDLAKIVHEYVGKPFISTWRVNKRCGYKISLPLESDGKYNFTVDWGDGKSDQITSFDQAETSHEYNRAGRYIVQLNGVVDGFGFKNMKSSCEQIVDISQWGNLRLSSKGYQFTGCVNLTCSAQDAPKLSSDTSFDSMFFNASSFNGDLSGWNTAACDDMTCMFNRADSFTGDLSGWDCTNLLHDRADMFTMLPYEFRPPDGRRDGVPCASGPPPRSNWFLCESLFMLRLIIRPLYTRRRDY